MLCNLNFLFCSLQLTILSFHSADSTKKLTPLLANNRTACIAENLRLTDRYICDADANVICITGWSRPDLLCSVPVCNVDGKTCVNGECVAPNACGCNVGWDGPLCDQCIPLGRCKHGSCNKPMECNCEEGWTGGFCDVPECKGCVHGCCHEPNKCICNTGWQGVNCSECMTLSNCKHGSCVTHPFECKCDPGWTGLGCAKPVCRDDCSPARGYCKNPGECICKEGWTGRNCDECLPYPGCKGTCIDNVPWTCSDIGLDHERLPDQWSEWTAWSTCSQTCGEGVQKRDRTCPPRNGVPGTCVGESWESKPCTNKLCSIDGGWSIWTSWTACSASCGTGTKTRKRHCTNPIPKWGGKPCNGTDTEVLKCFSAYCPISGRWSAWQPWSSCSKTCGAGTKERYRRCDSPAPAHGGMNCEGNGKQSVACNVANCPIDGVWAQWTYWSECSVTCGEGQKTRSRKCIPPAYGGRPCPGGSEEDREAVACFEQSCAINGRWSPWQEWSSCSVTCGEGTRMRDRRCDSPEPKFGGKYCLGSYWEQGRCVQPTCPIDGVWARWGPWGSCSVTCGGGSQSRIRACKGPQFGGRACVGSATDTIPCGENKCPINGRWDSWGPWTTCSASCGNGQRSRSRKCVQPQFGGAPCTGDSIQRETCFLTFCPVDGEWGPWGAWSICSKSCEGGVQTRKRLCRNAAYGGKPCPGTDTEETTCNLQKCPIDGVWNAWGPWTTCTKTCGGGVKNRDRTCKKGLYGGRPCEGSGWEQVACNTIRCPVDGVWAKWSPWSSCSKTCGGGTQRRDRICTNVQFGGKPCVGNSWEEQGCNKQSCPVDGIWGEWTQWSTCSVTCGGGTKKRDRSCKNVQYGGKDCVGETWEEAACSTQSCPVDGTWGQWTEWSTCSATCGGGTRKRDRLCENVKFGGKPCVGVSWESSKCNTQPCPIQPSWGLWTQWSTCSKTCGGGTKKRDRVCIGGFGGASCVGVTWEEVQCNTQLCPIDGTWAQWTLWSVCSVTCGGGIRHRTRRCINALYGGKPCPGAGYEQSTCNQQKCEIDGNWGKWTTWSACSVTCGHGIKKRDRFCDSPAPTYGGRPCAGLSWESQSCFLRDCSINGNWGRWTSWGSCSVTCGHGIRKRDRYCNNPAPAAGGLPCAGISWESESCFPGPCKIDGGFTEWQTWTKCTADCIGDRGEQIRKRFCTNPRPQNGGADCVGERKQSRYCTGTVQKQDLDPNAICYFIGAKK